MLTTYFRLTLLAIFVALPVRTSAQSEAEAEQACRDLGIEGLLQQIIVGDQAVYAANLINFCDSYRTIVDGLASLRGEMTDLTARMPPNDAILIVDDADGCPVGWRDMASDDPAKFAGRMALAAIRSNDPSNPYLYRQIGGEAEHLLTTEEMPPHKHTISSRYDDNVHNGFGGSGEPYGLSETFNPKAPIKDGWSRSVHPNFMSEVGGGKTQNNLPPYIALYFCKKDV